MEPMLDFDDIRPYNDDEIPGILDELLEDQEFLEVIKALRFPWVPKAIYPLFRPILRWRLKQYTARFKTVHDFQVAVESYLERAMSQTSDALDYAGQETLDPNKQYLFISNHRDIVLDPALCNLAVHRLGRKTCRIAIGDNLLTKRFAEHLMRINKSFIVKRTAGSGREWLRELKKLSAYIKQSLAGDAECVWIAQKEGRAKDGVDVSDPALLKMLTLSRPKTQSFASAVSELNILPIAVSYEWDPCDTAKARELAAKSENGAYRKGEHEDIQSIAAGIQGYKGRVSLEFGESLAGDFLTPEEVASAIDEQIIRMYRIYPSNLAAYKHLNGKLPLAMSGQYPTDELNKAEAILKERAESLNEVETEFFYKAYANPVISRLNLLGQSTALGDTLNAERSDYLAAE